MISVTFTRIVSIDPDYEPDYLQQPEFATRLRAYERGDFYYVSVMAQAEIIYTRNGFTTSYHIDSSGLYGIESDSDEAYLTSVFEQERAELIELLNAIRGGFEACE